jgi:hypothetical protein
MRTIQEANVMNKHNLVFVSFGSSGHYTYLAKHLLGNLKKAYPKSKTVCYSEHDLSEEYKEYAKKYVRGFGYFFYKPLIINDLFENSDDGDIIVYIEGRVHFKDKKITWLDDLLSEKNINSFDILIFQDDSLLEQDWTTGDILSDFNVYTNEKILVSGQLGTPYVFRVNKKTRDLVDSWLDYMSKNLNKCRDECSAIPNKKSFIENRYDQSVMSLLIKTSLNLRIRTISNSDLNKRNSLYSNYKSHPISMMNKIWNNIKIRTSPELIYVVIKIKDGLVKVLDKNYKKKYYWERK